MVFELAQSCASSLTSEQNPKLSLVGEVPGVGWEKSQEKEKKFKNPGCGFGRQQRKANWVKENFCQKRFSAQKRGCNQTLGWSKCLTFKIVMVLMEFYSKKLRVIHLKFQSSYFLRTFVSKKCETVNTETLLLHWNKIPFRLNWHFALKYFKFCWCWYFIFFPYLITDFLITVILFNLDILPYKKFFINKLYSETI